MVEFTCEILPNGENENRRDKRSPITKLQYKKTSNKSMKEKKNTRSIKKL